MLERIALELPKGVVIRSGKAAGFIPGADIKGFEADRGQGPDRGLDPSRPAGLPAPGRTALPDRRRDPRPLHGRRHRAGAGLPLSRGQQRRHRRASACPRSSSASIPAGAAACACRGWSARPAAFDMMLTAAQSFRRRGQGASAWSIGWSSQPMLLDAAIGLLQRGRAAPVQAARARLGHQHLAGAAGAGAADGQAGRAQGAQGTLPGAVLADLHLAAQRRPADRTRR